MTTAYPRDTTEYVTATVTADVDLDMTVAIAITRAPAAHVWLPAEWTGDLGTTRTARTTDPVAFTTANYAEATYKVYVKLTETPETPIIKAGDLLIN